MSNGYGFAGGLAQGLQGGKQLAMQKREMARLEELQKIQKQQFDADQKMTQWKFQEEQRRSKQEQDLMRAAGIGEESLGLAGAGITSEQFTGPVQPGSMQAQDIAKGDLAQKLARVRLGLTKDQKPMILPPEHIAYTPGGKVIARGLPKPKPPTTAEAAFIQRGGDPEEWTRIQKEAKDRPISTTGKMINEMSQLSPDDPKRAYYERALLGKGVQVTQTPDGITFTMGPGVGGPTKPVTTQIQKEALDLQNALQDLDHVGASFDDFYLTYWGKGYKGLLRQANKLGIPLTQDQRQYIRNHRQLTQSAQEIFNKYRKYITGAQATMNEIEFLKQAMLNPDLSPEEFKGAYETYRNSIMRALRLRRAITRQGITPDSPEFNSMLNDMYKSGVDEDVQIRGEELEKQGYDQEEIVRILQLEGFK